MFAVLVEDLVEVERKCLEFLVALLFDEDCLLVGDLVEGGDPQGLLFFGERAEAADHLDVAGRGLWDHF